MLLEVTNLIKEFQQPGGRTIRVVDRVSFAIPRGKTLGIVGESGCGKSTIGRCVLQLESIDGGSVTFDGERIDARRQRGKRGWRSRMQMVFQDPYGSMNPAFSVRRTLLDALRILGLPGPERDRRALELLDSVGLHERVLESFPNELSGGQLQRVAIARALATNPDFIFLDEPTSALGVSVRGQIVNLLAELQEKRAITYLFVSHDMSVVRTLADDLMVLHRGQVVESGRAEEVLHSPREALTRALIEGSSLTGTLS